MMQDRRSRSTAEHGQRQHVTKYKTKYKTQYKVDKGEVEEAAGSLGRELAIRPPH